MRIETDRSYLRPPETTDLPLFVNLCMNSKVTEHFDYIKRDSVEDVRIWLAEMINTMQGTISSLHYVIVDRDLNEPVGFIGIGEPEEKIHSVGDSVVMNFGYAILPEYWGRGYASEALSHVIPVCFATFSHVQIIHGECDIKNIGSKRVMEKAGMRFHREVEEKDGSRTVELIIERGDLTT